MCQAQALCDKYCKKPPSELAKAIAEILHKVKNLYHAQVVASQTIRHS
jgi:hypothetical protein